MLQKKAEMREQFISFMKQMFEKDQAEAAPPLTPGEESWYLPIFWSLSSPETE